MTDLSTEPQGEPPASDNAVQTAAEGSEGANREEITGEVVNVDTLNADQQRAVTVVEEICASAGLEARVVVRSARTPYLHIEMLGSDIRATFGRLGQGLDALQLLCNMILPRHAASDVRVMLDAEGYRERRAESLRQRVLELAREVKARKEECELEPLPAHERRIIHAILAEDPDISTYSEGDEPNRRIVISPIPKQSA